MDSLRRAFKSNIISLNLLHTPYLILFVLLIIIQVFYCQAKDSSEVAIDSDDTLPKVYLICSSCDLEYIRQEIDFINYTNHPGEAEITILITNEGTASGGNVYQLCFKGNKQFKGISDTLKYISKLNETEKETNAGIVNKLTLGLLPYFSDSKLIDNFSIEYSKSETEAKVDDKWDSWVFSLYGSSYFSGEESSNSVSLYSSFSAERETDDLSLGFTISNNYSERSYLFDSTWINSISRSNSLDMSAVFSLDSHFSAGVFHSMSQSLYSNIDMDLNLSAGIEYNIFPYSVSSTRRFSISYRLGYIYNKYIEETIYDRIYEHLGTHTLLAYYYITETWGSISSSLRYSNYLHDFSKKNLYYYLSLSINVVERFAISIWGSFSMIHNQIYLPKGDISMEDLLLQRKSLQTNYRYYFSIGFSYTFGSIYNNTVNTRFKE